MALRLLVSVLALPAVFLSSGCLDVRDFEGPWTGERVGQSEVLRRGFAGEVTATLVVDHADLRSLAARLTIDGLFADAPITPVAGAEADVLASATFDGAPSRVFFAFAENPLDGGGSALVVVALYDDPRVELRVLRGGPMELYGIFSLHRGPPTSARARPSARGE